MRPESFIPWRAVRAVLIGLSGFSGIAGLGLVAHDGATVEAGIWFAVGVASLATWALLRRMAR